MAIRALKPLSKSILDYVKAHPGSTSHEMCAALTATHTHAEVTSFLWSLWNGRYITRKRGVKLGGNGAPLYEYYFHSDSPRRRQWGSLKKKPSAPRPNAHDIDKMLAPTGTGVEVSARIRLRIGKTNIHVTLAQARELHRELGQLVK